RPPASGSIALSRPLERSAGRPDSRYAIAMVLGENPSVSPQALAVARSLLADVTTGEVTTAFRHANIRSVLLKGPTIARWLYEHVAMRPYVDSDLLIAVGDLDRAEEVLAALGFE